MTTAEQALATRVLLVDDDPTDRFLCKRLLAKSMDCVFVEASSVEEAIDEIRIEEPDLILLDYYLGAKTGLDLLKQLQEEMAQPFPVVMLTGEGSEEVAVEVMKHGALDYLPKAALKSESLLRASSNVLEKMRMQRVLRQKTSDLARARAAAEAANRAKDGFLAAVSHELRTPLTAIIGFAEELADCDLTAVEQERAALCVLANGRHLLQLINDLLDLSRIEAGKLEIELQDVVPVEIAELICQLLEGRARDKGVALVLERLTAVPGIVETDPTRLNQILLNLVGNAIKFTHTGSVTVSMSFDESSSTLRFDVADTGIGMTEAQIDKLFEPFSQAEASTARRFGGSGLGLSISKHLAHLLGGRITVTSVESEGSTFSLALPVAVVDDSGMLEPGMSPARIVEARTRIAEPPRLAGRVLLAEDIPVNRVLIERILRKSGANVTVVEDGTEAVDQAMAVYAGARPYDVILMDMQMPIMDGYQATRRLRHLQYEAPIIALTAAAMAEDIEACMAAGCDAHAAKPIDRKVFIELLAQYMPTH